MSFSATGASLEMLGKLPNPASESRAYSVAIEHLKALREGNTAYLSDEKFLKGALPLFMRSVYARDELVEQGVEVEELKALDKVVMAFLDKHTPTIAKVFSGGEQLVGSWQPGYNYAVTRGSLVFTTPAKAKLIIVVFTPGK